jgi:hypothetical protein
MNHLNLHFISLESLFYNHIMSLFATLFDNDILLNYWTFLFFHHYKNKIITGQKKEKNPTPQSILIIISTIITLLH